MLGLLQVLLRLLHPFCPRHLKPSDFKQGTVQLQGDPEEVICQEEKANLLTSKVDKSVCGEKNRIDFWEIGCDMHGIGGPRVHSPFLATSLSE